LIFNGHADKTLRDTARDKNPSAVSRPMERQFSSANRFRFCAGYGFS